MPRWTGTRRLVAVALLAAALLVPSPSDAVAPHRHVGFATTYTEQWSPNGNCGVSKRLLDVPYYAALNLYSPSGKHAGRYDNGANCGRFIRVTIEKKCSGGINDGALGKPFCRGGRLVRDRYTGASLVFQVADSCPDDNAWCRTSRDHLDLDAAALAHFRKGGATVHGLGKPTHWNNRQISWTFVRAPHYRGDLRIGFVQNANRWWPTVSITHLPDGISGVRYRQNGRWHAATVVGDRPGALGNVWTIGATTATHRNYRIRVLDSSGVALHSGRQYRFRLPASCCSRSCTRVHYTTSS